MDKILVFTVISTHLVKLITSATVALSSNDLKGRIKVFNGKIIT